MERKYLQIAIDQCNWERYRRGYANEKDVVGLKDRLRAYKKNEEEIQLGGDEIQILINSTYESIKHINQYDYGNLENAEFQRLETVTPIYEFYQHLKGTK